jgi:hypothetical protein
MIELHLVTLTSKGSISHKGIILHGVLSDLHALAGTKVWGLIPPQDIGTIDISTSMPRVTHRASLLYEFDNKWSRRTRLRVPQLMEGSSGGR